MTEDWITTTEANAILNTGITDRTFRDSFRDCLPWKPTPGKKMRWLKSAVEQLAHVDAKAGKLGKLGKLGKSHPGCFPARTRG